MTTLYIRDGDTYQQATPDIILQRAQQLLAHRVRSGCCILRDPATTREFLRMRLAALGHEVFAAFFLDNHHRLIEYVELYRGTIDGTTIHTREVIREALARRAAAVIFCHNHPSGIAEPSPEDVQITRRLKQALAYIDVRVLDHLIIAESTTSFAERGLL
jgi:DNA repair protein RadC